MSARRDAWMGENWIRQEKRLALYLRDGLACVYCGARVENGVQLSLDHLRPVSKGGTNGASNLVTCCRHCNTIRGNVSLSVFLRRAFEIDATDATTIRRRIQRNIRRRLPLDEAKKMIARRGSVARVLATL